MLKKLISGLVLLFVVTQSHAQTSYVTDDFEVMMRTGPSIKNKIIRAVRSGVRLEVLRKDAGNGHSQVQTSNGEIGYVLTRFLTDSPAAKNQVVYLKDQLKKLSSKPNELRRLLANSQAENQKYITQTTLLTDQYRVTKKELDQIKRVSADAVNLSEKNTKLESEVQQLLLQLDDIRIQNETLKDQSDKRWFLLGGSAIVLGLFLGWILSISRRQRRDNWGSL